MMVTCMNDPGTGADAGSAVQPGVQPVLLRDPVHAGPDPVHGYAGRADVRLRGRATTIRTAPIPDATPAIKEVDRQMEWQSDPG